MQGVSDGVFLFKEALNPLARRGMEQQINALARVSPFRRYRTRRGPMSVEMTNCGEVGWYADWHGYCYKEIDPETGRPWPHMPSSWGDLALCFARLSGFPGFTPDVCLINRYETESKMGLHVDKDEAPEVAYLPIVSVSLGADAEFVLGGLRRDDPTKTLVLSDGDVLVMGGPARLRYHGIKRVREGRRTNLTFRRARP